MLYCKENQKKKKLTNLKTKIDKLERKKQIFKKIKKIYPSLMCIL